MNWRATIWFRSEAGLVDVEYDLENVEDIRRCVLGGAYLDSIVGIAIKRIKYEGMPKMTIEDAEKLEAN